MQKVPPASQVLSLPETALGGLEGMPSGMASTYDRQGLITQEVCICIFSHSCSNLVLVLSSSLTTCHDLATLPPSTTLNFCLTLKVPHTLLPSERLQFAGIVSLKSRLTIKLTFILLLGANSRSVFPHSCLVLS